MLHKDIGQQSSSKATTPSTPTSNANKCPEKDCCEEDKYEFFDTPWLALIKTSTMFVGEIEFSDIPIDGGNVSVTFGYLFLMAFVFLIVMVLMNLLNGLAVSDIAKIQEESAIESNIATITTIAYFESVLLGDPFGSDNHYNGENNSSSCRWLKSGSLLQGIYTLCPRMRHALQKVVGSTGMLLFFKCSYMDGKQLTLPLKQHAGGNNCSSCCTSCLCPCENEDNNRQGNQREGKCDELLLDYENAGCEEILRSARKIMAAKKLAKALEYNKDKQEKAEEARRSKDRELLRQICAEQANQKRELAMIISAFNDLQRQLKKNDKQE